jgi:hypothetical protein
MTAPTIIEAERVANLELFEEALAALEGFTPEHLEDLGRASTTTGSAAPFPETRDTLGQAAYTAAALRAMAEALVAQQERISELEKALKARKK